MNSNKKHIHDRAFLLAAAGLLHDAGKVLQPSGKELSNSTQELERMICPEYKGYYSHKHVLFTDHVFQNTTSDFGGMSRDDIQRLAIYHHRPSQSHPDESLLTKADWIASGHDRQYAEEQKSRTGLLPIISSLQWPNAVDSSGIQKMVPTRGLSFSEKDFMPSSEQSKEKYQEFCAALTNQLLNALETNFCDPSQCVDGLLGITERLFHSVPASRSREHQPDVTLFDHSRIVAALAACLAVQFPDGPCDPNDIQGQYRFVTLGVGSIQKFIFRSVPSLDSKPDESGEKGMAKRLRARSFYISLLSWLAARKVLDSTGLPVTNILYDAGGHSLILIPDVEEVLSQVRATLDEIGVWIRSELGGIVRVDYAISDKLDDSDFHPDRFGSTYRTIEHRRACSQRRFPDSRLQDANGWNEKPWIGEQVSLSVDQDVFQNSMKSLGEVLPKSYFLSLDAGDKGGWKLDILGYHVQLHEKRPSSGSIFALSLDASEELATPLYLAGNYVPIATNSDVERLKGERESSSEDLDDDLPQPGQLLTFSNLAHLSEDEDGSPIQHAMLGALKADVDRLGSLISYGFGEKASLGRLASLSRVLDLFFKGFLTEKLRTEFSHVYTVFAGGDDLFLIGPWYDLVRLLGKLNYWFKQLTCGNSNVHFSAGLVFSKPTTPVSHLVHLSETALDKAKESGRNRVCYGSITLDWQQFDDAFQLHRLLMSNREESPTTRLLNTSITYRLLKYSQMGMGTDCFKDNPPLTDLKWRAQLSYDLKRNLPNPTAENSNLKRLQEQLLKIRTPGDAKVLYTAASLTLYRLRGERQNER